jgi:hypothetical protein
MSRPWIRIYYTHPKDARGWIALGCFLLVLTILAMILWKDSLLESDAFLILATAIVITGWVQGPVGWAYQATKGGGEAAESSARIAEKAAEAAVKAVEGPTGSADDPYAVEGADIGSKPVSVQEKKGKR